MLPRLERLIAEVAPLHSKVDLLVGPPDRGKTALLRALADRSQAPILNLGAALGRRLATIAPKQRQLQAGSLLREIADRYVHGDRLLVDNIELLFDATLQLNPLDLLKRQAQARPVVAVWPGELRSGGTKPRLTYAEMGHPEYRDYAADGVVPFDIQH